MSDRIGRTDSPLHRSPGEVSRVEEEKKLVEPFAVMSSMRMSLSLPSPHGQVQHGSKHWRPAKRMSGRDSDTH